MTRRKSKPWEGDVHSTPGYGEWFRDQDEDIQNRLIALQLELRQRGPLMGPEGSKPVFGDHPIPLRELRIKTPAIRVLYTFDPDRNAVLLHGGDKTGLWDAWYVSAIAEAIRRYREYARGQHVTHKGGRR